MEYDKITEHHLPRSSASSTFTVQEPPNGLLSNAQILFAVYQSFTVQQYHKHASASGEAAFRGNPFSPQQRLSQRQLTETGAGTYLNTTLEPFSGFLLKFVM